MSYCEYAPPQQWANVIECVWTRLPNKNAIKPETNADQPSEHLILPDCAMDIIAVYDDDGDLDDAFAVGSMTKPQLASVGDSAIIGIRFLPGVGGTALGTNATALTDDQAGISDVLKDVERTRDAFRALRLDPSNAHALHLFINALRLEQREVPPLVRQAARQLGQPLGNIRIEQVAKNLNVSRQHLTRVFSAHSGLTPKLFAQICRVRSLLAHASSTSNRASSRSEDSWSMLAAEFGYVDQSHMIAEVHSIVGQTPAAWLTGAGSNIPIVPVPVTAL